MGAENPVLIAALNYHALGWSVLPLCPPDHVGVGRAHRGCKNPGKVPFFPSRPDGAQGDWKAHQSLRLTEDELRALWEYHPRLNVGVALGVLSRLAAIDVDDEDGETLLRELSGGDLPDTWEYATGKGRRLVYELPDGVSVRNTPFTRSGTEIEILRLMGQGGQVVLPPSVHPNGSVYRWKPGHGPGNIPAAPVPAWMRAENLADDRRPAPADGELIQQGGRDNYLTAVAGAMRKRGCHEEAIHAALDVMNRDRCDPPLESRDVARIARSVARYAPDDFTGVTMKMPEPGRVPEVASGDYNRRFKWMSELSAPPRADEWIWRGYLPKGAITLLSALWKAGKTTLLSHLLKAIGTDGDFLGQPIRASRVLYVSEEGEQHWVRRRDDLGIGDHTGLYLQPFGTKPDAVNWLSFIGQLKADIQTHGFDLVVFDTLAKLWPVREENDAGEVDAALMPLWELTKVGCGVLLIHHLRKSGGAEYTGSRGSGALSAFPDVLIELTRFDAHDPKCRKRKLLAKGRYEETPDELVIELVDGEYRHIPETPDDAGEITLDENGRAIARTPQPEPADDERKVLKVLQQSKTPWLSIEGIREGIRSLRLKIRDEDARTIVDSLVSRKQVVSRGVLRSPKNPRLYALSGRVETPDTHSAPGAQAGMSVGNESPSPPENADDQTGLTPSQDSFPLASQGRNESEGVNGVSEADPETDGSGDEMEVDDE